MRVIADGFTFRTGNGWDEHGEIGLAACGRKRSGDVLHFSGRIGKFQDEHVLGEPTLVPSLDGYDTEGMTFLTQQCISGRNREP